MYRGETTFNFVGRRWWGFGISIAFVVVTVVSLFAQGLNLGIDFKGGVAWEVPASTITIEDVRAILDANEIPTSDAKIQILNGAEGQRIRAQVGEISTETRTVVQAALSVKAGVELQEVSVASVSSSWGRNITEKAVRALLTFFVIVSMYIAWRFEWKMAIAAILAMVHDVLISVGVYAVLWVFGHSCNGDRVFDNSRLLVVRHHRGVRQSAREHHALLGIQGVVWRHHQRVDEPSSDAFD